MKDCLRAIFLIIDIMLVGLIQIKDQSQVFQEPHCLNTSILDCSVTFTVDKDIYIHGLEVPSQVTDIPEQAVVSQTTLD